MSIIDNFETMLANGQDSSLLRFGLGQAYLGEENYDLAITHLTKALEFDNSYSAAWKLLGKAYVAIEDTAQAIHAYEQGIGIAEEKGDIQAAKEMRVFLKRLTKNTAP